MALLGLNIRVTCNTVLEGHTVCPTPVDWDKDGKFDLLLGAEDGHFYLIKNNY